MGEPESNEKKVELDFQQQPEGELKLALRGRLDWETAGACWRQLEERLHRLGPKALDVDVTQLELGGGIGIALLRYLDQGGMSPGARVHISGLTEASKKLLDTFTAEDFRAYKPKAESCSSVPEEVGVFCRGLLLDLRDQLAFIGGLLSAVPPALAHPRRFRWLEIRRVIESAGANALPVVAAFSWLVGLVTALEAARPLQQLGAQIFIADMIGFSAIRDTGPIVTAIMLAGRSGSAFAAELGTMKVNQELDALKTMGLEPMRFLVIQRVIAALILTPILSLYAMLMSIVGGILVMRFLGFPPRMIYHQMAGRIHLNDLSIGLGKALIFGLIVGAVGCLRGLQTKEGPQAVGVSTTRAVVAGILLVILANTLFSSVQYLLSSAT